MSLKNLRKATLEDIQALEALIVASARELGKDYYTCEQIEAALQGTFGVDSELIRDGTYWVAECEGQIVGCGGWSFRKTMFGGDSYAERESERLDPKTDSARIRAFFVDPRFARQGIGSKILQVCEDEARANGFHRAILTATLPGHPFYLRHGYIGETRTSYEHPGGVVLQAITMSKPLG